MTTDHWAGTEGETYPVMPHSVWAVGNHVLVCSDLMASRVYDTVLGEMPPTLLYCDPPWGQGLVNSFRTKAGLGRATYRWEQLYRRIADIGHSRGLPVWVEGSARESRDGPRIPFTMRSHTHRENDAYWPILYGSNSPAGLYYSGPQPYPPALTDALAGQHDRVTPGLVMSAYGPGGIVADPSAGLGGTPLNAERSGWGSVCNELNPYRMSAALVRLAKATGAEPEQLK